MTEHAPEDSESREARGGGQKYEAGEVASARSPPIGTAAVATKASGGTVPRGPFASSRRKFYGYFTVVLSLAIVTAGVMWIVYGYLPNEYYFPVSFSLLGVFGIIAYVILSKRLEIS